MLVILDVSANPTVANRAKRQGKLSCLEVHIDDAEQGLKLAIQEKFDMLVITVEVDPSASAIDTAEDIKNRILPTLTSVDPGVTCRLAHEWIEPHIRMAIATSDLGKGRI